MSKFVLCQCVSLRARPKFKYGKMENSLLNIYIYIYIYFFFLSGFSSQTMTIHRTAEEGRGPSSIPLYHFHPLTNIETFICNFACEMTITYF